MKYLITSSLLDSFDWLQNCPKSWQKKAISDFVGMLRREKRPTSPECQRGIDFEDLVCRSGYTDNDFVNYITKLYETSGLVGEKLDKAIEVTYTIYEHCVCGEQQKKLMKDIIVDNKEYHLFGYADIVLPHIIYDIKTTTHFKGDEAYLKRSQHRIYSICSGLDEFEYLVADYCGSKAPKEFHSVYTRTNITDNIDIISDRIRNLMKFIDLSGLRKDYEEIFTMQHKD